MDQILHYFETWEPICLLVFAEESSFQRILGGAGFRPSTVCVLVAIVALSCLLFCMFVLLDMALGFWMVKQKSRCLSANMFLISWIQLCVVDLCPSFCRSCCLRHFFFCLPVGYLSLCGLCVYFSRTLRPVARGLVSFKRFPNRKTAEHVLRTDWTQDFGQNNMIRYVGEAQHV